MNSTKKFSARLLSLVLCLAMIVGYFPAVTLTAKSVELPASTRTAVADPVTKDAWKTLFGTQNPNNPGGISTRYAGGVWMDKSVYTNEDAFANTGITMTSPRESMLVSLSAIGSNSTVTGRSDVPTDTVLVLDVSGSMRGSYSSLINAANASIATLMEANAHNRVSVVLYASGASLLMPLDHYSPGTNNRYINYNSSGYYGTVTVANNVRGDANGSVENTVNCGGGTYMQSGLAIAQDQFEAVTETTVSDPVFGTVVRKPIVVLMTDGDPTYAHTNFSSPGNRANVGEGDDTTPAMGFMVQLTAAYLKTQVETKYKNAPLFYTLGFNIGKGTVADNVMNPGDAQTSTHTTAINEFWSEYTTEGTRWVSVGGGQYVSVIDTPLVQDYVTRSFSAGSGTSGTNSLLEAFEQIIQDIAEKTAQFPTLVQESEEISGYVSFVDNLGEYMEVTSVKGVLIGDHLYSGHELAKMFDGTSNVLGTVENPTALGDELIYAVKARLGVDSDVARTLVSNAYNYGQLRFYDDDNWSNYIGWYGNAAGDLLNFYQEGVTVLPQATGDAKTDPVYTYKSYGYLGDTSGHAGVAPSDMMYTVVHVRTEIATGNQQVSFGVPASLLPLVTYHVKLDESGQLTDLTTEGATSPIELVYETALRQDITPANITKLVDQAYLDANTDPVTGEVYFYTNLFEENYDLAQGTVNTYSYFNPALSNSRYYYADAAAIYADDQGTLYTGSSRPSGSGYYRSYTLYEKTAADKLNTKNVFVPIDEHLLTNAQQTDTGWVIPAGNVYESVSRFINDKSPNATGTLAQSHVPFVDAQDYIVGSVGTGHYVGTLLGNNGRLSLTPDTGITIQKKFEGTDAAQGTFTFTVAGNVPDGSYPAQKTLADGTLDADLTQVAFSNGRAAVTLKAGESVTITGLPENTQLTVTESMSNDYKLTQINGTDTAGVSHTLTTQEHKILEVSFTNAVRGKGVLAITKAVEMDDQLDASLVDPFTVQVQLEGIGVQDAKLAATKSGETITYVQTDENGIFTTTLADGQTLELTDLYEGVTATVIERPIPVGFRAVYWENGVQETADAFGQVTVSANGRASVIVQNLYEPTKVDPVDITITGVKYLEDADGNPYPWNDSYTFTFNLERRKEDAQGNVTWTVVDTVTVNQNSAKYGATEGRVISFPIGLSQEQLDHPGAAYYRIREISENTLPGFNYDSGVHAFEVVVGDADMNGQLDILNVHTYGQTTAAKTQNTWAVNTQFTNVYDAGSAEAVIDAYKTLANPSGSSLPSVEGFTFQVFEAEPDPDQPGAFLDLDNVPEATGVTTASGLARMTIHYGLGDVGVHYYRVCELQETKDHWIYDTTSQYVKVTVSDDGAGTLTATAERYDPDVSSAATANTVTLIGFKNTYDPSDAKLPIDFVTKNLTGRDMTAGEFRFEIRQFGTEALVMTGSNGAAEEGSTAAVTFLNVDESLTGADRNCLIFDQVGTFFFNVVELPKDSQGTDLADKGVTADTEIFRLTVIVTDVNGQLTAAYRVDNASGNTQIPFANSYVPDSAKVALTGQKTLRNKTLLNSEFTFLLQSCNANGVVQSGTQPVEATNDADGKFAFPQMTYDTGGTWYYLVWEDIPETKNGITFDTTSYIVSVTVTDNGQGQLVPAISYQYLNGATATGLTFTNTYTAKPTTVVVNGDKELIGKVLSDGMFEFQLKDATGQVVDSDTNDENGLFELDLTHTDVGTYFYTVSEVGGGQTVGGITYDSTVYTVRVVVTDDQRGQLHSAITLFDAEGVPVGDLIFNNGYAVYGTASATVSGRKTLEGRDLKAGEFTFELYTADAQFQTSGTPETTTNALDGTFSFALQYSAQDVGKTFYYVVKEADGSLPGVSYSQQSYQVTIQVLDKGDGTMETQTTISDGTATTDTAAFKNTYKGLPVMAELDGKKVLEGIRPLKQDDFTFQLYKANSQFVIQGDALQSVTNLADGTFTFAGQSITEEGLHYFVVTESSQNPIGGVAYDRSVYHITVLVEDNKQGNMGIKSTDIVWTKDQSFQNTDKILFTNHYTAAGAKLTLSGKKTLSGRALGDQEFSFLLLTADSSFTEVPNGLSQRAYNKADGTFTFDELTFSDPGTYYYVVREDHTQPLPCVTYDEAVYQVTVTVTDDENGKLAAQAVIVKKGAVAPGALEFQNTYTPPEPVTLDVHVTKTVENKGQQTIGPEGFLFRVQEQTSGVSQDLRTKESGKLITGITFDDSDVGKSYTFKVWEIDEGKKHVTYSQQVYTFTVTVSLSQEGKLVLNTVCNDQAVTFVDAQFVNIYDYTPPVTPVTGDSTNLVLWMTLLMLSGGAVITLLVIGKKKEKAQ